MPTPKPHQLKGAEFLASRGAALLADQPRVGKTAAAIIAADYIYASQILVVTKSSARANWGREFRVWGFKRDIQVIYSGQDEVRHDAEVVIVGWGMVFTSKLLAQLIKRHWHLVILDESHEAKHPDSKRTKAVYNDIATRAETVWCLTGTPVANAPNDLYPMLAALAPGRLKLDYAKGWPDVRAYDAFMDRYCVVRKKQVGNQWIKYAIRGCNEDELRARMEGFSLRRTQQDVGITAPNFSVFALHARELPPELMDIDTKQVLDAIETGSQTEDLHLGTIRRLTGMLKAEAVAEAAKEMLDDGLDKLVLMYWHQDVGEYLKQALFAYNPVGISGKTPPTERQKMVDEFQDGYSRVFVGQVLAAGEAIDLSASCELWFVESSFVPKDMSQAAMRICNHTQIRQPIVRVCAIENSIDEALMDVLTRKVASIKLLNGENT